MSCGMEDGRSEIRRSTSVIVCVLWAVAWRIAAVLKDCMLYLSRDYFQLNLIQVIIPPASIEPSGVNCKASVSWSRAEHTLMKQHP